MTVYIYTGTKESNDFGQEIVLALQHAGLKADFSSAIAVSPITGFRMNVGENKGALANVLAIALVKSGLAPAPIQAIRNQQADSLVLTVGFKP